MVKDSFEYRFNREVRAYIALFIGTGQRFLVALLPDEIHSFHHPPRFGLKADRNRLIWNDSPQAWVGGIATNGHGGRYLRVETVVGCYINNEINGLCL